MAISIKPTSVPAHRLAESITASSTSFKLDSIKGWDGVNLTSADFGTKLYASFRNSIGTVFELMEIDPTTITAASSAITILKRGLKFTGDRTTEVTANKLTWVKGDTIIQIGTDTPQMFQTFTEYMDALAIAGAPNATTILQGLLELSTQAEIYSRTSTGGTGAPLAVTPNLLPSILVHDYVADTGAADAYVIAPSPAITAYATGQQFTFKATNANTTASTVNVNGLGTKSIKKTDGATALASGDIKAGQIVQIEYDGTNFQMISPIGNAPTVYASTKFGGTGVDGALTLTSGATNIDLAGVRVLVKNYSSISITGTGSLTFTNPHSTGTIIILRSSSGVTLTSSTAPMINCASLGADVGTGGKGLYFSTAAGSANASNVGGAGGVGIVFPTDLALRVLPLFTGGGGNGSNAGRGGGALYIECAGALNFTTAGGISVAGGTATGTAGDGGGAGGSCVILYGTLTSASGTITFSGGNGAAGVGSGNNGGAGGNSLTGGSSSGAAGGTCSPTGGKGGGGSAFGDTANGSTPTVNTSGGGSVGGGGGGAAGYWVIAANTTYA